MASTTGVSAEIHAIQSVSGNQPRIARIGEKATQTFLAGVPLQIDASGYMKEWDGSTLLIGIAGFSKEFGANLTTNAVAQTLTFGKVPYESSAVNIPRGAPLNDGKTGFEVATDDSVFYGQVGTTTAVTDVGLQYGLTKDTDGHWYIDKSKTGANAVVSIVALDTIDTTRGVHFTVLNAAAQIVA